jgi:3-hydroxyisobutyrate dehydrogenase-like beta-hydroxyacid dehydrogenase
VPSDLTAVITAAWAASWGPTSCAERADRAKLQGESKIGGVVAGAQIVVSAISDDAALLDIVFKAGGLKETLNASQIFVEISTVSPDASRRVAEAMSAIGVGYVRSPVSGSTVMAAQGGLTAVISGPAGALERLNDFYAAFTRKTFVVGQAEEARYLKLVLNSLVGGTSALLAEALAMGRKGGLGNAEMMDVICQSAVASPLLQYKRDTVVNGAYDPAFAVKQIMKDLDIIAEVSRQDHCPMPLVAQVRQQYEAAFVNGCGGSRFLRARSGNRAYRGPVKRQDLMNQRQAVAKPSFGLVGRSKEGARIWEARRSQLLAQGRMAPL